jgi:hypothetical protein
VLQAGSAGGRIGQLQIPGEPGILRALDGRHRLLALQLAFPRAWGGKKYSIKTGAAVRAFIRVASDVMERAREIERDAFDAHAIRRAIAPWDERLGDRRFETVGDWKRRLTGGTRTAVELLARELQDALRR